MSYRQQLSSKATRSLRFPKSARPLGKQLHGFCHSETYSLWFVEAQLFRVLDLIHEALVNDIPMTKRLVLYFLSSISLWRFPVEICTTRMFLSSRSRVWLITSVNGPGHDILICWIMMHAAHWRLGCHLSSWPIGSQRCMVQILQSMRRELTCSLFSACSFKGPGLRSRSRCASRFWWGRACEWLRGQRAQYIYAIAVAH